MNASIYLRRPKILRDEIIKLTILKTYTQYPKYLRLVEALVKIDGKEVKMTFITNNLNWAAASICDLYKSRWAIEVFFKQIKQNLQLCYFLGYSENANKCRHLFSRFITMLRAVLWDSIRS